MNTSINEDTKLCSKCHGSGTLQFESYVKIIDKLIVKLEVCENLSIM